MVRAIHYRVGQFFRALTARYTITEDEIERAIRVLTPAARELFRRQTAPDQRHALAVYDALCRAGHADPQLLAAALLHDVGKTAVRSRFSAWLRATVVLMGRFAPRLLARLIQGEPRDGWRHPFVTYVHHPEIGARWAQEAGCSPMTVALIRRHEGRHVDGRTEEDRYLAALQAADNAN
jgi:hypothetical protein